MSEKKYRHKHVKPTSEERRRYQEALKKVEANKAELMAEGKRAKARADELANIFRLLQAERHRQGMSLGDLSKRCGIDKSRLSRLENQEHPNVTIETLVRLSEALGKRLKVQLEDAA